jgi:alpha-glucosidase
MWNSDVFNAHNTVIDPLYISVPFFVNFNAERVYGIYFDNSHRSHFDMGNTVGDEYTVSAEGGMLDYYLITGDNIQDIVRGYTEITGRSPMPPAWALGHHQSKFSYRSEEEVLEIARQFRERDIPCDVIHLDIHYMNQHKVFTWDENQFPFPRRMVDKLLEQGIRLVAIIDPGIKVESKYAVYQELMRDKLYCRYPDGRPYDGKVWPGDTVFPDFINRGTRKWWGQKILAFMEQSGVQGIWHDMNEPAVFNETSTMDTEVCHINDGEMLTHAACHNVYALMENKAVHEAIVESTGQRPFILSRAGFAGSQRYSAVWTGDNKSMWEHLELSMPMLLNMSISGFAFAGSDIGGFASNADGELLTRWYQLGMFYPFFRNHSENGAKPQEPWAFGARHEAIIKACIQFRYQLSTELYNAFHKNHSAAEMIIRPLVVDYPADPLTHSIYDQFLFCGSLMVAPVFRPAVSVRSVYFPAGNWYDFHDGTRYQGCSWQICQAPLERVPLFVKGGGMLALNESAKSIGGIDAATVSFILMLDDQVDEGRYTNYNDDGQTNDYQTGACHLEEISYLKTKSGLSIRKAVQVYGRPNANRFNRFVVKNCRPVSALTVDGKACTYTQQGGELVFTAGAGFAEIKVGW